MEYFQEWRLHNFFGQLLSPSYSESVSLCSDVFKFVLTASCPWGSLSRTCLYLLYCLPSAIYTHWWVSLWAFFSLWAARFLHPSSYKAGSSPSIILVTLFWSPSSSSTSLWPWEAQNIVFLYTFCASVLAEAPCSPTDQASCYFSFLLTEMDSSWAWRTRLLNTNKFSWSPFVSRANGLCVLHGHAYFFQSLFQCLLHPWIFNPGSPCLHH